MTTVGVKAAMVLIVYGGEAFPQQQKVLLFNKSVWKRPLPNPFPD